MFQTLAELEQKWQNEVDDLCAGTREKHEIFFIDYHLVENKVKELTFLCFLKDVGMDTANLEEVVNALRSVYILLKLRQLSVDHLDGIMGTMSHSYFKFVVSDKILAETMSHNSSG